MFAFITSKNIVKKQTNQEHRQQTILYQFINYKKNYLN